MANKVKVWFDAEADFLEVRFAEGPGYMRETNNDAVMERVDDKGNILGFSTSRIRPPFIFDELIIQASATFIRFFRFPIMRRP